MTISGGCERGGMELHSRRVDELEAQSNYCRNGPQDIYHRYQPCSGMVAARPGHVGLSDAVMAAFIALSAPISPVKGRGPESAEPILMDSLLKLTFSHSCSQLCQAYLSFLLCVSSSQKSVAQDFATHKTNASRGP